MARTGDNLPTGFLGPVKGWGSLLPAAKRVLRWPQDAKRWQRRSDEGPDELDLVEITAFTESLGCVEQALADLAERLRPGGSLLCDIDNLQSARMLRLVVEGHPGSFDPAGSLQDPSQAMTLRRALAATVAPGLLVRDVLRVPSGAEEFPPELAQSLVGIGMLPIDWMGGAPPSRFWLHCEKVRSLAGSVVLAGDDASRIARTEAALRCFLPDDWEIVTGEAIGLCAQWNRAIAAARGDVVWFLRAGMEPSAAAFAELGARAGIGPVAPAVHGEPTASGDVTGMMIPRLDVLFVGPMPEHFANSRIALEEYAMRLESKLPKPWLVDVDLAVPTVDVEQPERFQAEADELVSRWSAVEASGSADGPVAATGREAPWQGRSPRITLCMIARDEERFLGECLEHARGAFDEFVLVDTGSTDRTVEIAESFGARVLHQPWQDDFAAPRNAGLQAATGDWILVLDADEFVQPGAGDRIRELTQDPRALGYHLRFVNDYGQGRTVGVMMVRLFRNLPGIAYENVIHEQVTPSLQRIGSEQGLSLLSSDVEVIHHGYSDEVMDQRGKNARNERLFAKQLERAPEDIYSHYKFGDFLRRVPGRGADAKRLLDRCLELILDEAPTLTRALPYAGEVAALCALEAERAGEPTRAREVIDLALRRFIPTPNLHYLAASLALADGNSEAAIHHYRRCLAYRGQVLVVPIQEGITGHVSLAGIAQAWLRRGERERAQRLLAQAIAIEPSYEVAHLALSRLWLEAGDAGRALNVLTDFLAHHPDSPGACQQTMLILKRIGRTDAARAMGRHAVRLLEARALDREAAAVTEILANL